MAIIHQHLQKTTERDDHPKVYRHTTNVTKPIGVSFKKTLRVDLNIIYRIAGLFCE